MSKKIEILENTLLKLLIRRGSDADRKQVVLSEGELGFTTDTKRVFVGDGQTTGGVIVGNLHHGSLLEGNFSNLSRALSNDTAFNTDKSSLYSYNGVGSVGDITNWSKIGGVYTAGDASITVSSSNQIAVGSISASNISSSAIGSGLVNNGTTIYTVAHAGLIGGGGLYINSTDGKIYAASTSPTVFITPQVILSATSSSSTGFTISAYPNLTTSAGTSLGSQISSTASALIVDTYIKKLSGANAGQSHRLIAAALNNSLTALNGTADPAGNLGISEYLVNYTAVSGQFTVDGTSNQLMVPLSTTSTGDRTVFFRSDAGTNGGNDTVVIRVIGYMQ